MDIFLQKLAGLGRQFHFVNLWLGKMQARRKLDAWITRQAWLNVHLFLALTAGLIFAVLGFTGSISVYREELDELLNPSLVVEQTQDKYQSLDTIMAAVRAVHPNRYGEWTLEMPRTEHSMMTAWFEKPRETFFERYAPLMVSVNPYTAEVVASRFWGQTAVTWILDLHTQLQWGDVGWNVVGACGVLLFCSVLSGLYLWWPGLTKIRSRLTMNWRSGWVRLLFDLHCWLGLLSASILLLLTFTGFNLSFPRVLEKLAGSTGMGHGETGKSIVSTAHPNNHPTMLEAAEFVARGPFPKAQLRRVTTPDGESGVYRVNLRQKEEVNRRHPYTTVWIDRWSGQIREVRDPRGFGKTEKLITWIWPLHTGEALGGMGRLVWFLTGQSLFFLYVSGMIRWLYKKGWVKDRPVNTSGLQRLHVYLTQFGRRLFALAVGQIAGLIRKISPPVTGRLKSLKNKLKAAGEDQPKDWF